ncbi:TRAP transporter substrate-binding protein [Neorhizobium sp. DT-125]|uniref:TRAP transporter substrate-binding protein n=1 Tax=Neorhizobium sp. DT-125 TaxID=3396163 RepID=UPI003F1E41E8
MSRYWVRSALGAATAAIISLSICNAAQETETLRMLMPWNQTSAGNIAVGNLLMKIIEDDTGGEVKVQKFDNGVVPPFEQLEPVMSGVFDLHYTNPSYHAGDTVIGQIMDTVVADATRRHSSGLWDMIDKAYQKRNLKLIAAGPSTGFQFLVRSDVSAEGTLSGMKIRSNPAYDGTIRALGGAPVQLPVNEVYTAMEKGLIDGTAFPVHGVVSAKIGEVSKFQIRPTFGQGTALVVMNLDKWNALSPELQQKMLAAGRRFEDECYKVVADIAAADEAELVKEGVPTKRLGEKAAAEINQYYNQGLWDQATKNGGEEAAALIKFVKDNDLVFNGF